MYQSMTLNELREDFERGANRSVSMPLAGAIVWLGVALLSLVFEPPISTLILLFGTGAIFPLGMLISKVRNEALISSKNPLAVLIGQGVIMVNLLWAVHIPLFLYAPSFVPLSLGIGLGLHWVLYSWIVGHPVGLIHAILRTALVIVAWSMFPEQQILAVGLAIVVAYSLSIYQMLTREFPAG